MYPMAHDTAQDTIRDATRVTPAHDALRRAVDSYAQAFGHDVPGSVIAMFATRPGALVAEIQQAVRQTRAVPGWRDHAKRNHDMAQVR